MRFVFKPAVKSSPAEYDGLMLCKGYLRLAKRTFRRFTGVEYVRLAYDTRANAVCLRPLQGKQDGADSAVYKLSRAKRSPGQITCSHIGRVMPLGRYRFAKKNPTGFIFVRDEKQAVKQA